MTAIALADDFNRVDATSLGTTPTGGATWQQVGAGRMGVLSNQAYNVDGPFNTPGLAVVDAQSPDGTVQCTMVTGGNSRRGLAFRVVDIDDLWMADQAGLQLYTAASPFITTIFTYSVPLGDALQVVLSGSLIIVNRLSGGVGGAVSEMGRTTDSTYGTSTLHGFGNTTGNPNDRWDDFFYTPPPPPRRVNPVHVVSSAVMRSNW